MMLAKLFLSLKDRRLKTECKKGKPVEFCTLGRIFSMSEVASKCCLSVTQMRGIIIMKPSPFSIIDTRDKNVIKQLVTSLGQADKSFSQNMTVTA